VCDLDDVTGETFDSRYSVATRWQMHNYEVMKENGVYQMLYKQEPDVAIGSRYDYDYYESIS